MIDLYTVKLNNNYDFIQNDLPTKNGTWLCGKAFDEYKRGYSYQINGENVTRIEQDKDAKILNAIQPTYDIVKRYLGYDRKHRKFGLLPCDCSFLEMPMAVDFYISQMIAYDVFNRGQISDLKSESIGNYSYTKEDYQVGNLYYPSEIVSGLDVFKKVKFL